MTPAPFQCPKCGSYDVEWLSDEEIRCLDCGNIFRYPPGALKFLRREEDLKDTEIPRRRRQASWNSMTEALEDG